MSPLQPAPFRVPLLDEHGQLVETWRRFFLNVSTTVDHLLINPPNPTGTPRPALMSLGDDVADEQDWSWLSGPSGGGASGSPGSLVAVTDDNATNATMYPTWVSATPGPEALKTSSTMLTWNPTGVFGINGTLNMTGAGLINALAVIASGSLSATSTGGNALTIGPVSGGTNQAEIAYNTTNPVAAQIYGLVNTLSYTPVGANTSPCAGLASSLHVTAGGLGVTTTGVQASLTGTLAVLGTGTGAISDLRGLNSLINITSSNPITQQVGLYNAWGSAGSGTVTVAYGLGLFPFNSSSATITTNAGLFAATPTGGGVYTNNYGGLIQNQGATGIVNAYGLNVREATGASSTNVTFCIGTVPTALAASFYNASTVNSYFAGSVGIGTTGPTALVEVTKNAGTLPDATGYLLRVLNADTVQSIALIDCVANNGIMTFRRGNGTSGALTKLLSGDSMGTFAAAGYKATAYSGTRAAVRFSADQDWTDTANGTSIGFYTTINGAATPGGTLRFQINNIGNYIHTQAEADTSYVVSAPTTGSTVTMAAGQQRQIINPAGTLALLTVTLPSTPIDGQIAAMGFTQIITGLTINAPGGATVVAPPTTAAVDSTFQFLYQASSTSWFPTA